MHLECGNKIVDFVLVTELILIGRIVTLQHLHDEVWVLLLWRLSCKEAVRCLLTCSVMLVVVLGWLAVIHVYIFVRHQVIRFFIKFNRDNRGILGGSVP